MRAALLDAAPAKDLPDVVAQLGRNLDVRLNSQASPSLKSLPEYHTIIALPPGEKARLVIDVLVALARREIRPWRWGTEGLLRQLCIILLRSKPPLVQRDFIPVLKILATRISACADIPFDTMMKCLSDVIGDEPLLPELRKALQELHAVARPVDQSWFRHLATRVDALMFRPVGRTSLRPSLWVETFESRLRKIGPKKQDGWYALVEHANRAGTASSPSAAWRKIGKERVRSVSGAAFDRMLEEVLAEFPLDPDAREPNGDFLKGMIRLAGAADRKALAPTIGRFAEQCFKKVPRIGARSMKLGNASLAALSELGTGVVHLSRLKTKVRYPAVRQRIDSLLRELAARGGHTPDDLEEIAVPDLGWSAVEWLLREKEGLVAKIRPKRGSDVYVGWS
jgi:hypothetical protein